MLPVGNEVGYRVEKSRYALDMEGFWLRDRFRIIADLCYPVFPNLNSENYKLLLSITGPAASPINPCPYQR
jgi:hypothetical protein